MLAVSSVDLARPWGYLLDRGPSCSAAVRELKSWLVVKCVVLDKCDRKQRSFKGCFATCAAAHNIIVIMVVVEREL